MQHHRGQSFFFVVILAKRTIYYTMLAWGGGTRGTKLLNPSRTAKDKFGARSLDAQAPSLYLLTVIP